MLNYYYAVEGGGFYGPWPASQHFLSMHNLNIRGIRVLYAVSCRLKP